jgi:hypothetical protein
MNQQNHKTMNLYNTTDGKHLLTAVASGLIIDSKLPAKVTTSSSDTIVSSSREAEASRDSRIGGRYEPSIRDETLSDATAPPAAAAKEGHDEQTEEEEGAYTMRRIYHVPPSDAAPGQSCLRRVDFTFKTKKLAFCNNEPAFDLPTIIKKAKLKLFPIVQQVEDGANLSQLFENMKSKIKFHKKESARHKKERDLARVKADDYKADAQEYYSYYREQRDSLREENAELRKKLGLR